MNDLLPRVERISRGERGHDRTRGPPEEKFPESKRFVRGGGEFA